MNETMSFEFERISQLLSDLKGCIMQNCLVSEQVYYADGTMDLSAPERLREFNPGDTWGGFDQYGWFHLDFLVPPEYEGEEVWIEVTQDKQDWYAQNPQMLLYLNGHPVQGIDMNHETCLLQKEAKAGERFTIDLDAWSGMTLRNRTWDDRENRAGMCSIRFFTKEKRVEKLYYDMDMPFQTAKLLGYEQAESIAILKELSKAADHIDMRIPGSEAFLKSVEEADRELWEQLYQGQLKQSIPTATAMCVGHTHIDIAWMWQFSHTRNKVLRSFATALKLGDEYQDYLFMSSQPQLYSYVEEQSPELFERIKERIAEGRWEPEGGMWVEADCNLTSGESLIRQFLVGKQYFQEKFGKDNQVLWLPDVFGYSAALPQICKKCGIEYFMTTKISWNEQNKIPYDTFLWKGIDGTEMLTHFAPAKHYNQTDYNPFGFARSPHITTYNGILNPDHIMGGWKRYSQKYLNSTFLVPYGFGDGGGGTTREMIENGLRLKEGVVGCPTVKFSGSREFFETLKEEVQGQDNLPVWYGELYLEFHRGTYTSVACVKRWNRRAENLLQRCEFLNAFMYHLDQGYQYPKARLDAVWKKVLTNQFHDILPGSAIDAVYEDVRKIYEEAEAEIIDMTQTAADALTEQLKPGDSQLLIMNTIGMKRDGVIRFPCQSAAPVLELTTEDGTCFYAQKTPEEDYAAWVEGIKGSGYLAVNVRELKEPTESLQFEDHTVDNGILRITWGEDGTIRSIYDKEVGREVLNGLGNVLETYEDRPYQYDAWELSPYYRKKQWAANTETTYRIVESGPVRIAIAYTLPYLNSKIDQTVYIYKNSRRIDFDTTIDWKEEHILLKTAFPVDVVAQSAVYEIQFGNVERPTHTNTSWDSEKFETCAQRWADLSEHGYGVSLLNDCKYGYDIHDGVMRLSLLRFPTFPNRVDCGIHHMVYSVYPHIGGWRESDVMNHAYDLNNSMMAVSCMGRCSEPDLMGGGLPPAACLIDCDASSVMIETIKLAETKDGLIVRAYEYCGGRSRARFTLPGSWKVCACTMLEEPEALLCDGGNSFEAEFTPYEIKTFKMQKY